MVAYEGWSLMRGGRLGGVVAYEGWSLTRGGRAEGGSTVPELWIGPESFQKVAATSCSRLVNPFCFLHTPIPCLPTIPNISTVWSQHTDLELVKILLKITERHPEV